VELYAWSWGNEDPTARRVAEANELRAAGVVGDIRVYRLPLLLVNAAAVQIKGQLSWKMRESHQQRP